MLAVVGGLALIHFNPALALGVFVILLSIILYFAPKIFRAARVKLWLIWKKLNGPADREATSTLPTALPSRYAFAFTRENLLGETVAWAVPCISKRAQGVPANSSGLLVATNEDPAKLIFIARQRLGRAGADDQRRRLCGGAGAKVPFRKPGYLGGGQQRRQLPIYLRAWPRPPRATDRGVLEQPPPCASARARTRGGDADLTIGAGKKLEVRGFEPLAFSLRTRRSTN